MRCHKKISLRMTPSPGGAEKDHAVRQDGMERNMGSDVALGLLAQILWGAVTICAPILACTLVVGLAVSVLQVVTQVQDMSLTFIPKLLATVLALTLFGAWMMRKFLLLATDLISGIPAYF
jgi:flagellar biosynthetic protein FliQ